MKRTAFLRKLAKRRVRNKARLPTVLVMTDETRLPDPVSVARSMPAGWGLVFRHYDAPNRSDLATRTADICKQRTITFLIAGNWRLADRVQADGVHLPKHALVQETLCGLNLWRRSGKLVTVSAHDACGLRRAARLNADGVMLSPVEATASHPDQRALGALRFAALVRSTSHPVIALGGVSLSQHARLTALGATAIAGISLLNEI